MQLRRVLGVFLGLALLIVGFFVIAFPQKTLQATGVVEGQVTIGPICPVVGSGMDEESCKPTPEMYAATEIIVTSYESDGKVIFAQGHPQPNGYYRIDVPAGHYWIQGRMGNSSYQGSSREEIVVEAGKTLQQNIDIDTGIR